MTQSPAILGDYRADFKAIKESRGPGKPPWLTELADQAWSSFSRLGFPTARRGNEKWKYTNVGPIAKTAFTHALHRDQAPEVQAAELRDLAPVEADWATLVFVNGIFSKGLSTGPDSLGGIRVSSLAHAIESDGRVVEQHLAKHAGFEDDGFTALNTAFLSDGAFVEVPDGCSSSRAVHLVFITSSRPSNGSSPLVCHPRTLISVGRNARLTVVETYAGWPGARYFTNAVTEIDLGDASSLDHYRLMTESPEAFHVGVTRVSQGCDSRLASTSFALGTALARNDLQVLLDGPGGSCVLNGLYLTSDSQHMDNLINIDHAKPHTASRLYFKGILDGKSKAVFGGEVLVRRDAQKVDAQQTDKNLLLSDQAEVDSKPSLLIYADDVQCGHGATAGHIDEDSLFYLRSRGLDREAAGRMLIHAFAREIIETVKIEPLQKYLDGLFLRAIPATGLPFGSRV